MLTLAISTPSAPGIGMALACSADPKAALLILAVLAAFAQLGVLQLIVLPDADVTVDNLVWHS